MFSLCYTTLSFQVKYLPGDIFDNLLTTGISEIFATFATGYAYTYLGTTHGFTVSYASAIIGVFGLLFLGYSYPSFVPVFLFLLRVGLNMGINLFGFMNVNVFPTVFTASAIGICNFFARLATIFAPQIATKSDSFSLGMIAFMCVTGLLAIQFIRLIE